MTDPTDIIFIREEQKNARKCLEHLTELFKHNNEYLRQIREILAEIANSQDRK